MSENRSDAGVVRRLAAILAADVAGYSRLMGADEVGTLQALKAHRKELIDPSIAAHRGRIVKTTGDGMLVEFASAVDAVQCAVEVQRAMAERNAGLRPDRRIQFRVGINVGDIIVDGDDIYGDGVNVAARLEAMSEPGGICISRSVRDPVRDKLAFSFEDLGEQTAKNIARPIRAYRVRHGAELADAGTGEAAAARTEVRPSARPSSGSQRRRLVIGGAILAVAAIAVIGGVSWRMLGPGSTSAMSDKPSIAVLPFANLSGDPAQEYFSDGIAEEILTALSRSPYLKVIARNSSFALKGKAVDARESGRMLGVRFLLEGSVQRSSEQIRITAQLIDARDGAHVWAERYDRPLKDVFSLEDEITGRIAARLDSRIQSAEIEALRQKAPSDITAYDLFLRGRALVQSAAKQDILAARRLLEQAIERDPDFALPYAELAYTYYLSVALSWELPPREEALAKGFGLVERALALDPRLPLANMTMGDLLLRRRSYDEAIAWANKAVALNPNDPENYAALANILAFVNRGEESVALMEKALPLDPLHPPLYEMYIGRALLLVKRFDEAVPHLRECARRAPDFWVCHSFLAVTLAQRGDIDAARSELAEALRYTASLRSVAQYRKQSDWQPGPQSELVFDGLTKAGLPPE